MYGVPTSKVSRFSLALLRMYAAPVELEVTVQPVLGLVHPGDLAAVALGATGALASGAGHFAGSNLLPLAKISLAQARATAIASRPGQITDQELENEGGGTGLRYSFDIKNNGKTFEVGVDARTGKVLENKSEGANPD